MNFSTAILEWYHKHKRELPWRNTRDPYYIWLSEIILQQTRVAQGLPYYEKFVSHFPSVKDLADASEDDVLKLWQGLGYYSRARNLHATAKKVAYECNGKFPDTFKGLLQLKGVGDYTASAIASICYDHPEPVVDGNVYRVLSRYFGVDLPINSSEGIKYFKQLAKEVMSVEQIRDYNQGIMEFGAMQCTPQNPDCSNCPLNKGCAALKQKLVAALPVKLKKTRVKNLFFNYLVPISENGSTLLNQRTYKGIWQNLWQFPLLESEKQLDSASLEKQLVNFEALQPINKVYRFNEKPIVHKLSHRHLHTTFWIIEMGQGFEGNIRFSNVEQLAVPVLIADFIKTFKNSYF